MSQNLSCADGYVSSQAITFSFSLIRQHPICPWFNSVQRRSGIFSRLVILEFLCVQSFAYPYGRLLPESLPEFFVLLYFSFPLSFHSTRVGQW